MKTARLLLIAVIVLAVAIIVVSITGTLRRVAMTETEVQQIVVDTILNDRPEAFFVTGTIEFATQIEERSDRSFLPGILNLSLGTTRATVRAPGRAVYGFDASALEPEDIVVRGDTVFVVLPRLEVLAVEPDLDSLDLQVDVGWARLYRASGHVQSLQAVRALLPAMRRLAEDHLVRSAVPREHSEQSVTVMLRPALQAAGMKNPIFVFAPTPVAALAAPSG